MTVAQKDFLDKNFKKISNAKNFPKNTFYAIFITGDIGSETCYASSYKYIWEQAIETLSMNCSYSEYKAVVIHPAEASREFIVKIKE